jgi:RNA polymerase sigma-70 factor (sigma-E family)
VQRRTVSPAPEAGGFDFDSFYAAEHRRLYALAVAMARDHHAAEDLVQETMARAYARWARLRHYEKPGAWARRVLLNEAVSRRRRWQRDLQRLARLQRLREQRVELAEPDAEVWAVVARLPRRQRQVVVLRYVEELRPCEIAAVLDCSVPTVDTHLARARARLALALEEASS